MLLVVLCFVILHFVVLRLTKMISFEMACELQNPLFLFKYSVLDSRPDDLATSGLLLFPFPVLLVPPEVPPLLREGRESKASPEKNQIQS